LNTVVECKKRNKKNFKKFNSEIKHGLGFVVQYQHGSTHDLKIKDCCFYCSLYINEEFSPLLKILEVTKKIGSRTKKHSPTKKNFIYTKWYALKETKNIRATRRLEKQELFERTQDLLHGSEIINLLW